jgi:hypothetical protein
MVTKVQSVSELIAALGGPKATGDLLDATPQMVIGWRERGALPARRYPIHVERMKERGIIAPLSLWSFDLEDKDGEAA